MHTNKALKQGRSKLRRLAWRYEAEGLINMLLGTKEGYE